MPVQGSTAGPTKPVYVVALTGGIATGKTAVSRLFEQRGVPVIDTDIIAREIVEPGKPVLARVVATFGDDIVDAKGHLKRRVLRDLILSNRKNREKLEALMHPEILAVAGRQIDKASFPYCLLVIPLLAEIGGFARVDRVLLVDATRQQQLVRLTARDGVSTAQANAALNAQSSPEARRAIADDVIDNSGDISGLDAQVEKLHRKYLKLSQLDSD